MAETATDIGKILLIFSDLNTILVLGGLGFITIGGLLYCFMSKSDSTEDTQEKSKTPFIETSTLIEVEIIF